MEQFYVIVITIAIVLLILALTYIGVFLIGDDTTQVTFPPHSNQCPDYWEVNGNGSCEIQKNGINLGTKLDGSGERTYADADKLEFVVIDPLTNQPSTNYPFQPTNTASPENIDFQDKAICEKKQWANRFGVAWDGVTNYNKC